MRRAWIQGRKASAMELTYSVGILRSLRQSLAETDGGKGTVTACSAPAESADGIHGILSCVMDSDIRVDE